MDKVTLQKLNELISFLAKTSGRDKVTLGFTSAPPTSAVLLPVRRRRQVHRKHHPQYPGRPQVAARQQRDARSEEGAAVFEDARVQQEGC